MNYNFEFNSPAVGRIQPFEYSYATTNEYAFTYGRDIFSDLSEFNAPIFVHKKRRGIFFDKIYFAEKIRKGFSINNTEQVLPKSRNGFEIHEDISGEEVRQGIAYPEDTIFADKYLYINIIKELLAREKVNNLNILQELFIDDKVKKITITNIKTLNKHISIDIFDDYFLSKAINNTNIYKTIALDKPINNMSVFDDIWSKYITDKYLSVYDNTLLLVKPINILNVYKDYMLSKHIPNKLNIYNNYFGNKPINELQIYDYIFMNRPIGNLQIYKYCFTSKPINSLQIHKNYMLSEAFINEIFITKTISAFKSNNKIQMNQQINLKKSNVFANIQDCLSAYKNNKITYLDSRYNLFVTLKKYADIFKTSLSGIKQIKDAYVQYNFPRLSKDNKQSILLRDNIFSYHDKRKTFYDKENLFAYKFGHNVFLERYNVNLIKNIHESIKNDTELFFSVLVKDVSIKSYTDFLYKDKHNFSVNNTESFLYKDKHENVINNTEKFLYKDSHDFIVLNYTEWFYKDRHGFVVNDTESFLDKNRHGFIINDTKVFLRKIRKGFVIDNFTDFLYKNKYFLSINVDNISLSKAELPLGIIMHNNTIGLVMSQENVMYEKQGKWLSNSAKNVFTDSTNMFLEKEDKHANKFNSIFVITENKKAFLKYYHGLMLSKTVGTYLMDKTSNFLEKQVKNGIIYDNITVTKERKEAFIKDIFNITRENKLLLKNNEDIFVKKQLTETVLYNVISVNKVLKTATLLKLYWLDKEIHATNILKQESASKNIYEAYVSNDEIFVDKALYEASKNTYLEAEAKEKRTFKNSENISTAKNLKEAITQEYVFITKQQYEANSYVSEMIELQKIVKNLERPVEKTYNWVWVYQPDDPIDPNYDFYGLDELLLPEKDVDYSAFEDIIFDKKNMMPRNPIKIIDDNTFIAKYPIKHPTPDFEEIGIVYIDVPSELMYAIFMKFYQIWYANIFKFGSMSMVDSLRMMLEYMYAHIVLTYSGTEYLEPALRVFRQIRWFGETSVMHNAQYKITCEYEDLKSNLQTGECLIKNQLSGFYVDKQLKVLVADQTTLGHEAYIKLYASNRDDSKISFSISFTSGTVEVYINNTLVETINTTHTPFVSYDLPATSTENEIVLKRSATSNYGLCYIGNIIIKNGTCKSLNIEYDPDLKAGNMSLNDVVNKMIMLANMYDNQQEAFEQFRKGNLAVSELYKRLESYWELHHANKIKGKRLTIKET